MGCAYGKYDDCECDHCEAAWMNRQRLEELEPRLKRAESLNVELLEALEEALGDVDTMEAAISADLSSYDAEGLLNTFGHMRRSMSAAIAKARGEG